MIVTVFLLEVEIIVSGLARRGERMIPNRR